MQEEGPELDRIPGDACSYSVLLARQRACRDPSVLSPLLLPSTLLPYILHATSFDYRMAITRMSFAQLYLTRTYSYFRQRLSLAPDHGLLCFLVHF